MKMSKNILMIAGIIILTSVTTLLVNNLMRKNENKAANTDTAIAEVKKNKTVVIKEGTEEEKEEIQENDIKNKTEDGISETDDISSNQKICSDTFSDGNYSGKFRVTADGDLSYYTEYLEIEDEEIRIYPTFNSQTKELSFNIRNDNVKISCK